MDKDDPAYLNTATHPVMELGYATEDSRIWICDQCFADFHERFSWKIGS